MDEKKTNVNSNDRCDDWMKFKFYFFSISKCLYSQR